MTPLTLSGACFWITVPDTLQQQTAECHLVRCHMKWLSAHTPGAASHHTKIIKSNEKNALVLTRSINHREVKFK